MKVTLAYAYDGHRPDETVDLPRAEALKLIGNGEARRSARPVADPVDTPTPKPAPKRRRPSGTKRKETR